MKPEEFSVQCRQALGGAFHSVILYGSAVTGDFVKKRSDHNLLLVAREWTPETMEAIRPLVQKWIGRGNSSPLLFTPERLQNSADVFPMEMLDILDAHRILDGDDPLADITVDPVHLRHQVEFELRSKLMALRQAYLECKRPGKELAELMIRTVGSILVVFRGALRCFEKQVPPNKKEALDQLAEKLEFPTDVFEQILRMKAREIKPSEVNARDLFSRYLMKIELVLDRVDERLQ